MENLDYFKRPEVSRSTLWKFRRSSKSGAELIKEEVKKSDALLFGSAFHLYMESEEKFYDEFLVYDESKRPNPDKDFRNAENKQWKKEILEENENVITSDQYNQIKAMKESAKSTEFYNRAFSDGIIEHEREFYANIEGLDLKIKTDVSIEAEHSVICIDYKTTSSEIDVTDPYSINRELKKFGYDFQAVQYTKVLKKNFPTKRVWFVFLIIEKDAPHEVIPVVLSENSGLYVSAEFTWNKAVSNYKDYKNGKINGVDAELENGLMII